MENAVEALMMAFAVIVFVGALTFSVVTFTNARETSEMLLYSKDDTNYYEYIEASKNKNRIVGIETVIPTLYRYYKENYTVIFKQGTYHESTGDITVTGFLPIYQTITNAEKWNSTYDHKRHDDNIAKVPDNKSIIAFDLDDESKRHEPWVGNTKDIKRNLDTFVHGGTYTYQYDANGNPLVTTTYNSFYQTYKGDKFVETLGEYALNASGNLQYDEKGNIIGFEYEDTSSIIDVDGEIINLLKPKKKRIITYTLITGTVP